MIIKNEALIKELIKEDYFLPLSKIQEVDFILEKTDCKTIEDCKKVQKYIRWYTDMTIKSGHNHWTDKITVETFYRYLKEFDGMDYEVFPKRDLYSLTEILLETKKEKESEYKKLLVGETIAKYDKSFYTWDRIVKENEE